MVDYYERKNRMKARIQTFLKSAAKIGGMSVVEINYNLADLSMGKKAVQDYLNELLELDLIKKIGDSYSWNEAKEKRKEAENEFDNVMKEIGAVPKDE